MKVAVIGAGISGLTIANLLSQNGNSVKVYDSAKKLERVGAGFTLQPQGISVLEKLGLLSQVTICSAKIGTSSIYDPDGIRSNVDIMANLSGSNESYSIHRGDFHSILLSRVVKCCELVHPVRITDIYAGDDKASLTVEGAESEEFDLVIGADGVRSLARKYVEPTARLNTKNGIAVRALVPTREDEAMESNFRAWMGRGKVILTYPVKNGSSINIASYQDDSDEEQDSWSNSYSTDRLRKQYDGWDPVLGDILSRVESSFSWKLVDTDPLNNISKGRVVFIGDAAHPMLPYLGQGANQAIGDAESLARSLIEADRGTQTIDDAIRRYEKERKTTTATVQQASRIAGGSLQERFRGRMARKRTSNKPRPSIQELDLGVIRQYDILPTF